MPDFKSQTAYILGGALILAAAVFGTFYYSAQSANTKDTLSVTGSAKTHVTSDRAKLVLSLSRVASVSDLASGYTAIARDRTETRALLSREGASSTEITEGPVSMNQIYEQYSSVPNRYQLNQTITIQSEDVEGITAISKKIPELASKGVIVSIQSLEYYYSKLPDLRVSLLTDAVKDAKARAEKIAAGTGRSVGSVQSASSGVVQVLAPNSVDVSDYGNYDTWSIEKEIMVTVKASFRLK